MTTLPDPATPRSLFVTVLAWLGIAFGTMGVLVSLLQMVLFATIFPDISVLAADPELARMPPIFRVLFENFGLFIALNAAAMAAVLAGSIGLLRRRNWGRVTIVVLLALAIASNFAGVALQVVAMDSMMTLPGSTAPPDLDAQMAVVRHAMVGFSLLFAVGFAVLYGWLIRRLLSAAVRREFGVGA